MPANAVMTIEVYREKEIYLQNKGSKENEEVEKWKLRKQKQLKEKIFFMTRQKGKRQEINI